MAKDIEIGVAVDTKAAKQGLETGLIEPLEDAQSALEDLGRARGPEQLERGLEGAQEASERLQRETRQTAEVIEREFRQAYAEQMAAADRAAVNSREVMAETKNEALQNASEVFSSFDGSTRSLIDGVQGTFGGLIASLGAMSPALIPIGIAGAAAVGLISAALEAGEEDSEEFRAKVAELTDQLIESGVVGKRSFEDMVATVRDLATETDDNKTNLEDLKRIAESLDRPFEDVVRAYTAGGDALDELIDRTEELQAREQIRATSLKDFNGYQAAQAQRRADELAGQVSLMRDQANAIEDATEAQRLYYSSGISEMEAKAALIEQINTAYDDAAGATQDFIDAETGLFDVGAYIEAMKAREEALRDYQDTLATSGLSSDAVAYLNEQGQEAAAAMLAGYKTASPAQRAELDRIWSEAARQNSGTYLAGVKRGMTSAKVAGPKVELTAPDVGSVVSKIRRGMARTSVSIPVKLRDRYGREY